MMQSCVAPVDVMKRLILLSGTSGKTAMNLCREKIFSLRETFGIIGALTVCVLRASRKGGGTLRQRQGRLYTFEF